MKADSVADAMNLAGSKLDDADGSVKMSNLGTMPARTVIGNPTSNTDYPRTMGRSDLRDTIGWNDVPQQLSDLSNINARSFVGNQTGGLDNPRQMSLSQALDLLGFNFTAAGNTGAIDLPSETAGNAAHQIRYGFSNAGGRTYFQRAFSNSCKGVLITCRGPLGDGRRLTEKVANEDRFGFDAEVIDNTSGNSLSRGIFYLAWGD